MRNKCKFLFILIFVIAILFYRVDSAVAMAAEEKMEPELIEESAAEPESEQIEEPIVESEPEQIEEPIVEPEPEQIEEPIVEPEPEQIEEPVVEPEPELIEEFTVEAVSASSGRSSAAPDSEQTVSTGPALMEWLEAHKNTGGTVKLADHVVLDDEYAFCPGGINRPVVFVDTDKYTITITGEIELLSDDHLVFSGQPDGQSIFYVAEKGMLSLQGVTVESESYALWQEEGAGLVVSDCRISGSIHYADTPFVIYQNSICAIVEAGQTLNDVLPAQISCSVNRQGDVSNNEWVPLSWNLEGTEKQQEERQRFGLQGSFLQAASAESVRCTVVYNDYPLTFTDVKASVIGGRYTFQGGYTKPEKALPITVISEYSFDGESWLTYEETKVTNTYTGFFIAFKLEQLGRTAHSNIFIRLQWNDNGTRYFSNVLCYAADDLEFVEDIGGSRGGGTSIINPPDEPVKAEVLSGTDQTENRDGNNESGVANTDTEQPSNAEVSAADTEQPSNAESPAVNTEQPFYAESPAADTEQPTYAESPAADTEQPTYAESPAADTEQPSYAESPAADAEQPLYTETSETDEEQVLYAQIPDSNGKQGLVPAQIDAQTLLVDTRQSNRIVIILGFVLFSVIAGAAGFYVHSRSGTNR